jgi:zinc protease
MELGSYILGGGTGSRLFARVRGDEGLSYGISGGFSAPSLDDGAEFFVQASAAPQNVAQVEASVIDEIANVLRDGYSAEEVEIAKYSWAQEQLASRASDSSLVSMLVTNLHYDRTMQWQADLEAKIQALTPDEIRAAMNRHLDIDAMTIMKGGDFGE